MTKNEKKKNREETKKRIEKNDKKIFEFRRAHAV